MSRDYKQRMDELNYLLHDMSFPDDLQASRYANPYPTLTLTPTPPPPPPPTGSGAAD